MHKNKKARLVLSVILSLLTAIAVFTIVFAIELVRGWMSCELLQQTISSSGYSYEIIREAEDEISAVLTEHELPETVLADVWDEETLYRNFYQYASEILSTGTSTATDAAEFEAELTEAIDAYFADNGLADTDAVADDVKQTVGDAADIYQRYLCPSFLGRFYSLSQNVNRIFRNTAIVSALVLLLCIVCLCRMYHYKHHALQYMTGGVLAATIWNIVAVAALGRTNWLDSAGIGPVCYQNLIEKFLKKSAQTDWMVIAVECLALIILGLAIKMLRRKD